MAILNRLIGLTSPAAALHQAIQLCEEGRFAEALPLLTHAAKAGMPEAEYRIARCYLEGTGVPRSQLEGGRWLERAASHGYIEAQSLLAALCVHGLAGDASDDPMRAGGPQAGQLFAVDTPADPDFKSGLKWARQAADAGSAKAQALLAYILTYGPEPMCNLAEAHRWYERSAAAGCPEGNLGYALSLARHTRNKEDQRQIAEHLRRAAEAQLPTAIYLFAALTERGVGVTRDPKVAVQLYHLAAERGHRSAQVQWGLALMEGREVEQDRVAGESWLRRAALAGDPQAAALVGNLYVQSGPLLPNYAEAANWFRRAADAGDAPSARALASLYLTGAGVAQDNDEAARWLRVAAQAGDQASQVDLANLVMEGVGSAADSAKVAGWFKQAAAAGDLIAAFNLGICLTKGVGVEQDEKQAALWLRHAADGLADAKYMYGRMLADGRGVVPDLAEARNWFRQASEAGMPDAQAALAEMMVHGRGGPREPAAALALFEKAAAKGHSGAMFALGALHGGGYGLPTDRRTARRWFREAANLGHGQAQLMLGRYLARGVGGEANPAEAREWLERAVAQGVADAQNDLADLSSPSPRYAGQGPDYLAPAEG